MSTLQAPGLAANPQDGALGPHTHLRDALASGFDVSDAEFDRLLPPRARAVSATHWTRVYVVARAVRWLREAGVRSVLDVGSGCGKFCLVGALIAPEIHFHGVEHRRALVDVSRELVQELRLDGRVTIHHADVCAFTPPTVDAFYLYNPFEENVLPSRDRIDDSVPMSSERYLRGVTAVEALLASSRAGTVVLTNNGFGGVVPATFREVSAPAVHSTMRMWLKAERAPTSAR